MSRDMGMAQALAPLRDRTSAVAEEAVTRARLRVVPRRRPRARRVPFLVALTAILVGGVVGLLLFNTSLQQASFAASALQEQADTLTSREQALTMELDKLRDPQRVAAQAQRMGMVPAANPAFLNLSDGSISGVAAPATRLDGVRIAPRPPRKPAILDPRPIVQEVLDTAAATPGAAAADGHDGQHDQGSDQQARKTHR
jgi:cell division protein FtsB